LINFNFPERVGEGSSDHDCGRSWLEVGLSKLKDSYPASQALPHVKVCKNKMKTLWAVL